MQVANALNNNIRILFNPKVEAFKLFDFLMVKSEEERYLAQIIEIYDDKFDSSQNVAKLKLFYKITENNEVMPYDNFTPNRECEIVKVKQNEIENFINQDKETFIFGTNVKSSTSLNIQYNFFDKNAVVLADKVENVNSISLNLAKNLSSKKNVVIVDSTGVLEYDGAKKIKASKNFKMPLNYTTIDYVFKGCLADASLEFQTIGGEILNEIKKFARKQESDFIPFNAFTRVLLEQYKATPYTELKLLLMRLKKMQMDEIFARTKKDKEVLFKTIEKNKITILDLSSVDSFWQKAYLEYLVSDIEQEIYLITRINEENFDVDLINKIYCEKTNVKFVPNVSYNYKKLPSIMQHCKNYILMPSLYQRGDFLDANFALSNLISDGCIIFGENTDNFLYLANDYELEVQEKRKNYRKIALTLMQDEQDAQVQLGEKGDYFENQKKVQATADSKRLMQELSDFENQRRIQQEANEAFDAQLGIEGEDSQEESFEEIENPQISQEQNKEHKKDDFEEFDVLDSKVKLAEIKSEAEDEFQELDDSETENIEDSIESEVSEVEVETSSESIDVVEDKKEESQQETVEEEIQKENNEVESEEENTFDEVLKEEKISMETTDLNDNILVDEVETTSISLDEEKEEKQEDVAETKEEVLDIKDEHLEIDVLNADLIDPNEETLAQDKTNEQAEAESQEQQEELQNEEEDIDLSDDELDFFQIAEESNEQAEKVEQKEENQEQDEDELDLNDIADNSIDTSFEQIINTKNQQNEQTIAVDENTKINADILEKPAKKENLPIFKEEIVQDKANLTYKIGDVIVHKKYGRGAVTKTIKYEERQLLQIEFEESGKKLLDPKVADIKLEQ